jgi:hypothetical protein
MANSSIAAHKEVELRGYFMRHKSGGDVGFSWNKDDPKFSDQWERITAVPESPSPTPTAGGERQSIDTGEFQRLEVAYVRALHACEDDLSASTANAASNARAALIAHIDTWAGHQREQGYADQLPRIRHLEHERDLVLRAAGCAGDAVELLREVDAALTAAWAARELPASVISGDLVHRYRQVLAAAPTNTAPAVQPEPIDKRTDAEVLRDLTKEYDAYMADRAALVMGQSFTEWKDSRMRRGQNSASNGATGEKA